ncbi:MAG TPA: YheC/YheD family protein [Bacillota bacterium]
MGRDLRLGVLMPSGTLHRILRRRPAYEKVRLYAWAARRLGVDLVFFAPHGVDRQGRIIRGYYLQGGRWRRWLGPLPRVIHNRIVGGSARTRRLLRALARRRDTLLFNPPLSRDKWRIWRWLAEDPVLRRHLPATWPLTRRRCRRAPSLARTGIIAKPRVGAVGYGVIYIRPVGRRYRWMPDRGPVQIVGRGELRQRLEQLLGRRRRYILQRAVPLARYRGRRFDLRVPVQRGEGGRWNIAGIAVKRARRHPFLTNLGRGGRAHRPLPVLTAVFGRQKAEQLLEGLEQLGLRVAEHLSRRHPLLADLGVDIGIDRTGRPWLIEVNVRDQRWSLLASGQRRAFRRLYYNPIAFGRHLLETRRGLETPLGSATSPQGAVLKLDGDACCPAEAAP